MLRISLFSLLTTCAAAAIARAEDSSDAPARGVEEARTALSREDFPWYDETHDSLQPVNVRPESKDPNLNWNFGEWPRILATAITIAIFAVLAGLLVRAYSQHESTSGSESVRIRQAAVDDAARIEALPFQIRRGDLDFLSEARRLYEEGKYSEAIVYLFSYQLVDLDRHQVIRLSKGKTNRQYLRELRRQPRLRSIVEQSMVAFEEVFFGGRQLGRQRFEVVWEQLGQFTAMLAQPEVR